MRLTRAASAVSPAIGGRLAARLFFATGAPPPLRLAEAAVLERGRALRVPFESRELPAWAWGDAEAPTVLLVHGWRGRAGQLAPLVDPLLARGVRVVAFDGPGHGVAPGPRAATLPQMARAVAAVAEHLDGVDAVVAHSLGGAMTTLALARGLSAWRLAYIASPVDAEAWVQEFAGAVGLPAAVHAPLRRAIEARARVPLAEVSVLPVAARMHTPLLVVHDEDDREVPIGAGRALAATWPGATFAPTRGLGHRRILGDAAVIERVASFVAGERA